MAVEGITHLIINSPYEEPKRFWRYKPETKRFILEEGARRSAGYVMATPGSRSFDDPGIFVEIPLVNRIRPRVKAWRERGYPGVTGITQRLLEQWNDKQQRDESHQFFFCTLEAIETLIWLRESAECERTGIDIPGDGGSFARLCSKLATGGGEDNGDGDAHCMAGPQQSDLSTRCAIFEERFCGRARLDGKEPIASSRSLTRRELLRRVQHRSDHSA